MSAAQADFEGVSSTAVAAEVGGTSEATVTSQFGDAGQSQSEAGHNNNALSPAAADVAATVSATVVSDGNSTSSTTNNSTSNTNTFSNQESSQASMGVPALGPTAQALLALGLAGTGWYFLRRRSEQAAASGDGDGA